MPINSQDQVNLLKDILNNHQNDCCGSVSECEQLDRLVQSLLVNEEINDEVRSVLEQVSHYSQTGASTTDLNHHITNNQDQLAQWVNHIEQFS